MTVTQVETPDNAVVALPLERITSRLPVRRLSASGLARIQESMKRSGFLDNYPLIVTPLEYNTYQLIDGNHRYEAALSLGLPSVPCVVKTELSEDERYKLALQSNSAAETVVPSTLVTYAEFVWARAKEGYTHKEIGEMLGWSVEKVDKYSLLDQICEKAWDIILTTFDAVVSTDEDNVVSSKLTPVSFTEGLLRSILDLTSEQQLELVQALAHPIEKERISKGKFNERAKSYQARNEMKAYATEKLGDLGEEYTTQLIYEVYSGAYDNDWKDIAHPRLHKLIQSIRDEWERKNSMFLIHGDFYEETYNIGEACVDLVITDPPYNIATEQEFIYEGRSNVSQNFGEWDKHEHSEFIGKFTQWACAWYRILRPQGSGYVFTSDRYITHLREALENIGLHVKATIVWHKTNPGTQPIKTNFKSSVEYILFFTKGEGGHTFNWQGENEMHNFIESPICGGNERVVDAKGNVLHPTQKPEKVIKHLAEISSNRGDTIFDGFMGVGTSGKVAKDLGRKFIGIEQEQKYFEAAQRRLAE